ncbi:MAG: hypothetical protein M1504_02730 [Candidatus Marsarchaeota archaeon]|nr:hypothetical protein [Candidatus Marsarchaeota archaeon]
MQKQKSRGERRKASIITLVSAIRCGANLIPVKGLIYALSHAKANRHVAGSTRKAVKESVKNLNKSMKDLTTMSDDLRSMKDVTGVELNECIRSATASYVELFYALSIDERKQYLESSHSYTKRVPREENLLLIPALMASKGEPKDNIIDFLSSNIYKMPFRVLYHASKAAVHIELLEQSMGIKSAPEPLLNGFSKALNNISDCMNQIEEGNVRPEYDEAIKYDFIEEAVTLSTTSDMKIADFISEKVMPSAFTERMARRIIRKSFTRHTARL